MMTLSRKSRPRREPIHSDRWEIPSTFRVGGSRIRIPTPESAAEIRHQAAIFWTELKGQPAPFIILERHCQDGLTRQADSILNQLVGTRWPTLEFSDLKPIAVPFGRKREAI